MRPLRADRFDFGQRSIDFQHDFAVQLKGTPRDERLLCFASPNLAQSPGACASNNGFGIGQPLREWWNGFSSALVPQHNRGVAEDSSAFGPPQRRVTKTCAKGDII